MAAESIAERPVAHSSASLSSAKRHAPRPGGITSRPWWPAAKRTITVVFVLGVLGLIAEQAGTIDWASVWTSIKALSPRTLLVAGALAALSFTMYGVYDLIALAHTGGALRWYQVMVVGFVSYAFNVNLGTIVGAVAMRYRLYSRRGMTTDLIAQWFGLSVVTNWLGYLIVAGTVFAAAPIALPPDWKLGSGGLRLLGGALLALAAIYIGMCAFSKRREWHVRGRALKLPSVRLALIQAAVAGVNWMAIGGVVYVLLQQRVDYPTVLGVLLAAAIAGVVAHVPAGLGVLEAVFVTLLSHRLAKPELLAGLLAYRAVYYLAPLGVAGLVFLLIDVLPGRQGKGSKHGVST